MSSLSFECKPIKIEVAPLYLGYPSVTIWCRATLDLDYSIERADPSVGIMSDYAEWDVTGSDIEWTSDNMDWVDPSDADWHRLESPHTDIVNKLADAHEEEISAACLEGAQPDPDEMRDRMRDAAE